MFLTHFFHSFSNKSKVAKTSTPPPAVPVENPCRAIVVYRPPKWTFYLYTTNGTVIVLPPVSILTTGDELKQMSIERCILINGLEFFSARPKALQRKYILINLRLKIVVPEQFTLSESGFQNLGKLTKRVLYITIVSNNKFPNTWK